MYSITAFADNLAIYARVYCILWKPDLDIVSLTGPRLGAVLTMSGPNLGHDRISTRDNITLLMVIITRVEMSKPGAISQLKAKPCRSAMIKTSIEQNKTAES